MKKLISVVIFVTMAVLMSVTVFADSYVPSKTIEGTDSYNFSANDYFNYSRTVKSYLEEISGGYRTLSFYNGVLYIDEYNSAWTHTGTRTITKSGYIFGGCYMGETYNYIVWGQTNPDESDAKEVLRIEKYTKDWKTIKGYAQVFGANTYIPFDAGSLRMTETAGKLYIHTSHEMYASDDGLHHQANMTFVVDTASMTVVDSWYDVMNIYYGYVSHSFNQFILTDGEYIYRADHGDAYPRAVVITKAPVDGDISDVDFMNIFHISGATGDNFTGVSVGGFEMSEDNLILVGNSVDQNSDSIGYYSARNIFVTATSKEVNSSSRHYLTFYTDEDEVEVCTPHLVKINDDKFLIMWEELRDNTLYTRMVTVDGGGHATSYIETTHMRLSDCKPVLLSNGLVCWYVSTGSGNKVYFVDPDDIESANVGCIPAVSTVKVTDYDSTSVALTWSGVEEADGYIVQQYKDGEWSEVAAYSSGTLSCRVTGLEQGTMHKFRVASYTYIDSYYYKAIGGYSPEVSQFTTLSTVTGFKQSVIAEDGFTLAWDKHPYAEGYRLQRLIDGVWKDAAVGIAGGYTLGFNDEYDGEKYIFRIAPYTTLNGNKLYGKYTAALTVIRKPAAVTGVKCVGANASTITLGWDKVNSADGYVVQEKTDSGWTTLKKLAGNGVTTYQHSIGYDPGSEHIYRVASYKSNGVTTVYSYSSAVKMYCAPAAVTNITVTPTETSLAFSWNVVSSADGYYAHLKDDEGEILTSVLYQSKDTTSFTVKGLEAGKKYTLVVKPYKMNGILRSDGAAKTLECFTDLKAISGLTCTSLGSNFISVRWSKVENAEGYMVQKKTTDGWVKAADVKGNTAVSTKLTGLSAGTSYSIRVIPYNKYSNGSYRYGKSSSHITVKTAPSKVTGFAVTNKTTDTITLSWTKKTDTHGYKITAVKDGAVVATQYKYSLNTTKAVFEGLEKGASYTFTIEPFISYKGKLYMGEKSAELLVITLPNAVSSLRASSVTSSAVTFNWTIVSGADGYVIQVYKDGAWTKVFSLGSGVASGYRVTGLSSKTTYQFRIVSFAKDGTTICYGRPSAVTTITTL